MRLRVFGAYTKARFVERIVFPVLSNEFERNPRTEQFEPDLMHFVSRIRDRRFAAVDRERGIAFTFSFFDLCCPPAFCLFQV